jgi:hypothetical protein
MNDAQQEGEEDMRHLDEGTIHAWLDGQLPQSEAEAVESHVAECRPCADAVAEARGLIAASSRILTALDGVPRGVMPKQPVPMEDAGEAGFPAPVAADATPNAVIDLGSRTASSPAVQRVRRRWLSGPPLAAAATIILAVGTFTILRNRGDDLAAGRNVATTASGPFVDSSTPSPASGSPVPIVAAPPSTALGGTAGRANEAKSAAVSEESRALVAGARSEREQALERDRQTGEFSSKFGAPVANAQTSAEGVGKRAPASEPNRPVDEPARLAKERAAFAAADSAADRRQLAAINAAAPAPPQPKPDTSTVTVIRGRDVTARRLEARDARADAAAQGQAAQSSASTGFVRGRVTDGNNTGLATVQVLVAGTSISATTNDRGEYAVGGVPQGIQRLIIRRVGFAPEDRTVTLVGGQSVTLDAVVTGAVTAQRSIARSRAAADPAEVAPGAAVTAAQSNAIGCYRFGITPNPTPQPRSGLVRVPRDAALDGEIVPSNADGIWYRARDLARTGAVSDGLWRPVGTDGIELEWTYGTRTARIRLTGRARAMMQGTIDEFDRSAGTAESGTVVSTRRSCDG